MVSRRRSMNQKSYDTDFTFRIAQKCVILVYVSSGCSDNHKQVKQQRKHLKQRNPNNAL
jgi:hypothetical protein